MTGNDKMHEANLVFIISDPASNYNACEYTNVLNAKQRFLFPNVDQSEFRMIV